MAVAVPMPEALPTANCQPNPVLTVAARHPHPDPAPPPPPTPSTAGEFSALMGTIAKMNGEKGIMLQG